MRILVACEFSGVVRQAFRRRGHDAWSCDLLPAEDGSRFHYEEPVQELLKDSWTLIEDNTHGLVWDLIIAFPPCTHLAVSGARWFKDKQKDQDAAIRFFLALAKLPVNRLAIENPIGIMSSRYRKPDQIIQPWMFGHPESKSTCLWLKGLPKLIATNNVKEEMMKLPPKERTRVHYASPGPERWKERSRTYQGIADAMAEQWG